MHYPLAELMPSGTSRSTVHRRLFASIAPFIMAWSHAAAAENGPSVLVFSRADEELGRKLRAEASQAGLTVVPTPAEFEMDRNAVPSSVTAVVRVLSPERIELRITTEHDRKPITEILQREPSEGDSFGLRVVEELRARLVELKLWTPEPAATAPAPATPSPHPDTTADAENEAKAGDASNTAVVGQGTPGARDTFPADGGVREPPITRPLLWPTAGIGGIASVGGIGGSAHGAFGIRAEPLPVFAVTAQALVGVTENELKAREGSADIQTHLFLAQIGYAPFGTTSDFQFEMGLGAALLLLEMQGEATPPYGGAEERTFTGLYFVHADLARALSPSFRVRASLLFGVSAPRPVVEFDDREIAAWGRPFGGAMLTAELGLPFPVASEPRQ